MTKKLKEAILKEKGADYWVGLEQRAKMNPFYQIVQKNMKAEDCLDSEGDESDITPLGVVYDQVILGCEPYLTREIALVIMTNKASELFELDAGAGTAGDISEDDPNGCNYFPYNGASTTEVTVTANREKGITSCWRRKYLEDATWSVLAWQVRDAGIAIESEMLDYMLGQYILAAVGTGHSTTGDGDGLEFDEFADAIGAMEANNAHPDVCVVNPADYASLLKDDKFISTIYTGSTTPMKQGVVQTTFGVQVIRTSIMPNHMALFLEKSRAGALVIRRDVLVEPYERPECDKFGVVSSIRYGFGTLQDCAMYLISDT